MPIKQRHVIVTNEIDEPELILVLFKIIEEPAVLQHIVAASAKVSKPEVESSWGSGPDRTWLLRRELGFNKDPAESQSAPSDMGAVLLKDYLVGESRCLNLVLNP